MSYLPPSVLIYTDSRRGEGMFWRPARSVDIYRHHGPAARSAAGGPRCRRTPPQRLEPLKCRYMPTRASGPLRPLRRALERSGRETLRQATSSGPPGCRAGCPSNPFAEVGQSRRDRNAISGTLCFPTQTGAADQPERLPWSLPHSRSPRLDQPAAPCGQQRRSAHRGGCSIPTAGCRAGCGWGSTRGGWR